MTKWSKKIELTVNSQNLEIPMWTKTENKTLFGKFWHRLNYSTSRLVWTIPRALPLLGFSAAVGHLTYCPNSLSDASLSSASLTWPLPPNWSLSCRRLCSWRRTPSPRPRSSSSAPRKTLRNEGQRHWQIFKDRLPHHIPELPPDVLDDLSHHFGNVRTQKSFSGL